MPQLKRFNFLVFSGLLLSFLGCGSHSKPIAEDLSSKAGLMETAAFYLAQSTGSEHWKKRWWLEKTVRVLRGGESLSDADQPDRWMDLSKEEIVDRLLADPRFGDFGLEFNLHFLGFRPDRIKYESGYAWIAFNFPSALHSAVQLTKGEDYFTLMDLEQKYFPPPASVPAAQNQPRPPNFDQEAAFDERVAAIYKSYSELISELQTNPTFGVPEACKKGLENGLGFNAYFDLGIDFDFVFSVVNSFEWLGKVQSVCSRNSDKYSKEEFIKDLLMVDQKNRALFPQVRNVIETRYRPKTLLDIQSIDVKSFGVKEKYISYGGLQKSKLLNSSTNYNRKRAAYILKRYFCDDLNPVGVEDPKEHTGGDAHGTQPSCMACHYKLDPMAGFFRYNGFQFRDLFGASNIFFDDGASMPMEEYTKAWKAPADSGREWNVGYIRSANKPELNTYGSTLSDLHKILREAPEVKRCITKRMFEFLNLEGQSQDAGYISYLANEFTEKSKENSSAAFRWMVKQIVLGKTFDQQNPEPKECYDFAPGQNPNGRPPCRVAHILEKNCVSCHSTVYDNGNLALGYWIQLADGSYNFEHQKSDGSQYPMQITMQKIVDRLNASDPKFRMPKDKHMSSQERQELFLWAQEMMNGRRN
jgi:hypothetical protein